MKHENGAWQRRREEMIMPKKRTLRNEVIKVTDANTGKLKRYETGSGKPIAFVTVGGKLQLTPLGLQYGFAVKNGKLVERSSWSEI